MEETAQTAAPRWGQEGRDRKALAILATLRLRGRESLQVGTWLDIGCGSGGIAATLAGHVERVVGIDPEPWDRWQSFHGQHPNLSYHVGSYLDLDGLLGSDSCAVVVCNQVYEHVDDPAALLAAIHRVLRTDGVCYFAGPNLLWPIEPHVFWPFVHWLPRAFAQKCMRVLGSRHAGDLDAWSWSYWKLVRHFRKAGFTYASVIVERVAATIAPPHRPWAGHTPRRVANVLSPFSPTFTLVLRRSDT